MASLVTGLIAYCGIPSMGVTYLQWDGETESYTEPGKGNYTLPGAMTFDDAGDCRLGVCIVLNTRGLEPWASFGLFVSEKDGKVFAKLGTDKAVPIDVKNVAQCDEFYQTIVDYVKRAFTEPQRSDAEPIGFKRSANAEGQ
jgi:hypothetical protein